MLETTNPIRRSCHPDHDPTTFQEKRCPSAGSVVRNPHAGHKVPDVVPASDRASYRRLERVVIGVRTMDWGPLTLVSRVRH